MMQMRNYRYTSYRFNCSLVLDHSRIKTTSKNKIPLITTANNVCGTNPEETFKLLSVLDSKKLLVLI